MTTSTNRKPMPAMIEVTCERCQRPFVARASDRKRGWGRFCSKKCKADTGMLPGSGDAEKMIRNLAKPAAESGCGDPRCKDPNCQYDIEPAPEAPLTKAEVLALDPEKYAIGILYDGGSMNMNMLGPGKFKKNLREAVSEVEGERAMGDATIKIVVVEIASIKMRDVL